MGLFGFLKKCSQGTFGLIPRNWTYYYFRLLQFNKDSFVSPEAIMTAASVIDANDYFKRGQMTMADLDQCFRNAMDGVCGPVPCMPNQSFMDSPILHGSPGSFSPNKDATFELMVNYCVQFTAILLAIDTPRFTASDVITACVQSKPKIEDSITTLSRELARGKSNSYMMNMSVANTMQLDPSNHMTRHLRQLVKQN